MNILFTFWGVRGSLPCASENFARFGGNTSCVHVKAGPHEIILDSGTGIVGLGHKLLKENLKKFHIFFSHTHWDHIMGFPFFSPAFVKDCSLEIYGHLDDENKRPHIKDILSGHMSKPFFPVPLEIMVSSQSFHSFYPSHEIDLGSGVRIQTTKLNHPDGCCAYRIDYNNSSLCYVTDTEHIEGQSDQNILNLIQGANAVIYDSAYTEEDFPSKKGWGHSTWQEGIKLCQMADVKMMFMFHHDIVNDDFKIEEMEREANEQRKNVFAAREGMTISI